MKKLSGIIGVAILIASIAVGFSGLAAGSSSIVVIQGAEPTGLDPTVHREGITYNVTVNIFDSLLRRNADGTITPALAESFERVGNTAWIFHMRHGVTFHNGEPLTADAVKFTVDRIFNPDLNSTRATDLKWIKSVSVIDKFTVKITANKPFPLAEHYFSELQIVPPDYIAQVGDKAFNEKPVGTGPFKFIRWDHGNRVVLERNDDYWDGPSAIGSLTFRFISSPASRVTTLLAGDADLITDVPVTAMNQIKGNPRTTLGTATGTRVIFVGLDASQDSPLKNELVREALNYAVDKKSIITNLIYGAGKQTVTLLTEKDLGFNPEAKPYPYDPHKAKVLLAAAGYPDGFEITLDTVSGRYINDKQVAQAIAGYLGTIGIKVNVRVMEFGAFNKALFSHTTSPMYLVGWGNAVFDASYVFDFIVRSTGLLRTINDPSIDALIAAADSTTNKEDRIAIYQAAVDLINVAAPCIFLYKQPVLYGMSSRLDWQPRSDEFLWMYDAKIK